MRVFPGSSKGGSRALKSLGPLFSGVRTSFDFLFLGLCEVCGVLSCRTIAVPRIQQMDTLV